MRSRQVGKRKAKVTAVFTEIQGIECKEIVRSKRVVSLQLAQLELERKADPKAGMWMLLGKEQAGPRRE